MWAPRAATGGLTCLRAAACDILWFACIICGDMAIPALAGTGFMGPAPSCAASVGACRDSGGSWPACRACTSGSRATSVTMACMHAAVVVTRLVGHRAGAVLGRSRGGAAAAARFCWMARSCGSCAEELCRRCASGGSSCGVRALGWQYEDGIRRCLKRVLCRLQIIQEMHSDALCGGFDAKRWWCVGFLGVGSHGLVVGSMQYWQLDAQDAIFA